MEADGNESMKLKIWILDKAVLTKERQNFTLFSKLLCFLEGSCG